MKYTPSPSKIGTLSVDEADSTLIVDETNNRLGIGTPNPAKKFHVVGDPAARSAGSLLYASNQPVIIEDDNRPGIQLIGSVNNIGIIEFADDSHANAGTINFDHSTDLMRFGFADDPQVVWFDASGNIFADGGLRVASKLIEVANATTGTPSGDAGLIVERGDSDNAAIIWDESRDEFVIGTTSATGASTGDLTVTRGNLSVERIGAGTEQAQAKIHAINDIAASPSHSTNAVAIIEDDNRPALQFVGSASNIAMIQFGDNAAADSGMVYYDHGTDKLRVNAGGNSDRLTVDSSGDVVAAGDITAQGGNMTIAGAAPKLTIGDAGEEDTLLIFDGAAVDYRIGLDDGTDTLEIGAGSAHGTTAAIVVTSAGELSKIGQDTPLDAEVLTWDQTAGVVKWAAAAGGATADDENTILHCEIFAG